MTPRRHDASPEADRLTLTPAETERPQAGGTPEDTAFSGRQLYDFPAIAKLCGRSTRTVRWWAAEGKLRTVRVAGRPFVTRADLGRFLRGEAPVEDSDFLSG